MGMGKSHHARSCLHWLVSMLGLAWSFGQCVAQETFSGKQMTLTIGFIAGGTADADGRTIARYLATHIPGNPTVIVQNRPGAGGITSINSAFQGGRTERLGIYQLASAHILQQLAGSPSIRFDLRQMPVLGGWLKSTYVLSIRATSGFKTIADIRASKDLPNIGSQGLGTGTYSYTVGWQEALGIKFKLLHGYEGNEQRLAMERGEIDGRTDTAAGVLERPGWLQRFPALVQNGPEHHPLLPGVPTVYDLTPDPGALWETINNALSVDRPYVCAPGTTAEEMAVVRKAWDDMLGDPVLLEEAERRNWRVVPTSYKQIETFYGKVLTNTPAAVVQQLRTIFP